MKFTATALMNGHPCTDFPMQGKSGDYKDLLLAACKYAILKGQQYDQEHYIPVQTGADNLVSVLQQETIVWMRSSHNNIIGYISIKQYT